MSSKAENDVLETWARIPAWPAYEASTAGRVRRIGASQPLTPCPNSNGYLVVTVSRDGGATARTQYVHRLVAAAHLGDIAGRVVHHKNSCRQDARLINLEITTQRDNMRRAHTDGTAHVLKGEQHPEMWGHSGGHLTPVQVMTLRRAKASGEYGAVARLAREYGIAYNTADSAARGTSYSWVGATSLETELLRQEVLAARAVRKVMAQVRRSHAARAANPQHTAPAAAASARPKWSAKKAKAAEPVPSKVETNTKKESK
jgi:hypothetical protein